MRKEASSSHQTKGWSTKRSWNSSEYDKAALEGNASEWKGLLQSVSEGKPQRHIYYPPSQAQVERQLREEAEAREIWRNPNATQSERRWAARTLGYQVYIPPSQEEMEARGREITELERIIRDPATDKEARKAAEERLRAVQGIILY